jgi:hypothetical protein
VIVPVGFVPPDSVAVSKMLPPATTADEAEVTMAGVLLSTLTKNAVPKPTACDVSFAVPLTVAEGSVWRPPVAPFASLVGAFRTLNVKSMMQRSVALPGVPSVTGTSGVKL